MDRRFWPSGATYGRYADAWLSACIAPEEDMQGPCLVSDLQTLFFAPDDGRRRAEAAHEALVDLTAERADAFLKQPPCSCFALFQSVRRVATVHVPSMSLPDLSVTPLRSCCAESEVAGGGRRNL
jgi:hypothetical protein